MKLPPMMTDKTRTNIFIVLIIIVPLLLANQSWVVNLGGLGLICLLNWALKFAFNCDNSK